MHSLRLPIFLSLTLFLTACTPTASAPEYYQGSPKAKVVLTEYADFECPACGLFYKSIFPQLKKDYIDTGKVKYALRDFPLPQHQYAMTAAEATYCAGEQGKFWEMVGKLYYNQEKLTLQDISQYAEELGLNVEGLKSCISLGKYRPAIKQNFEEGFRKGIGATPTLFVGDKKITGVADYEEYKKAIEEELNR